MAMTAQKLTPKAIKTWCTPTIPYKLHEDIIKLLAELSEKTGKSKNGD